MKCLLCSPIPSVKRELGASQHTVELADAMRELGVEVDVYAGDGSEDRSEYRRQVREKVNAARKQYDVIDYPPFVEKPEGATAVCVWRSVLLSFHFGRIRYPEGPLTWRSRFFKFAKSAFRGRRRSVAGDHREAQLRAARKADQLHVSNSRDADRLIEFGLEEERVHVIPCGLNRWMARRLNELARDGTPCPRVGFVGSVEHRKGCLDIVETARQLARNFPEVKWRLIGARGFLTRESEVKRMFPRSIRGSIEVIMEYRREELPELLSDCGVGYFPSYIEGFGLGALEMMTAGLPVVAYDSPGPCDFVPAEWIVPPGDTAQGARRLGALLRETGGARDESIQKARKASITHTWELAAMKTIEAYNASAQL